MSFCRATHLTRRQIEACLANKRLISTRSIPSMESWPRINSENGTAIVFIVIKYVDSIHIYDSFFTIGAAFINCYISIHKQLHDDNKWINPRKNRMDSHEKEKRGRVQRRIRSFGWRSSAAWKLITEDLTLKKRARINENLVDGSRL